MTPESEHVFESVWSSDRMTHDDECNAFVMRNTGSVMRMQGAIEDDSSMTNETDAERIKRWANTCSCCDQPKVECRCDGKQPCCRN